MLVAAPFAVAEEATASVSGKWVGDGGLLGKNSGRPVRACGHVHFYNHGVCMEKSGKIDIKQLTVVT